MPINERIPCQAVSEQHNAERRFAVGAHEQYSPEAPRLSRAKNEYNGERIGEKKEVDGSDYTQCATRAVGLPCRYSPDRFAQIDRILGFALGVGTRIQRVEHARRAVFNQYFARMLADQTACLVG